MPILHTRGRPIRDPWPDDIRLGGYGFRCGYDKRDGIRLLGVVPPDQGNVSPAEFGEQAINPVFGAPYGFRDLTRGMGQRRNRKLPNGRYWYALNARLRAGRGIIGPALTTYTPATRDSTNGIDRFFESATEIFALNGRYALDGGTDGTGWTASKDFGAGNVATDVVVVQGNYSSAARYAWVGLGDSVAMYYFDLNTTWTQTTGADEMFSRAYAVDDTTLYRFDDTNRLWTCHLSADPRTAANWASATDRVGSKDHAVTRATIDAVGGLVVCKADDVYTLNADGSVNRLFGALQFPPASTNGEVLARWRNDMFLTYGSATYRLGPDGGLTQVGPELLKDNGSEVKGYVTAAVGTDFFMLAGLYNPDNGDSYLMEFTGELVEDEFGRIEPVWHGSITAAFDAKKITALHTSAIGAPSGHKMAYVGFSDGTLSKYVLACTPDPSDCDQERYSTGTSQVFLSRTYFVYPSEKKALLHATVEGDNLSSTNYVQVGYRTNAGASYTSLSGNFDSGERERINFPDASSCVFIDPRITLVNSASTGTPQFSGVSFYYQLRTIPQEVMQVNVLADDALRKRDGTPYRRGAEEIRTVINTLGGLSGGVTFIDPNGDTHKVTVNTPERTVAWHSETRQPHDAIKVTLVEQQPNETRGVLGNLNYYTLAELEAFLLAQLEEI